MEIDHINGDKKDDAWGNLQELTKLAHAQKTAADNPGSDKKVSETQGLKIFATHIETGDTLSFNSPGDAAHQLGLTQTNIAQHMKDKGRRVVLYTFKVDPLHNEEQAELPDLGGGSN
jgi:hypothetical protein